VGRPGNVSGDCVESEMRVGNAVISKREVISTPLFLPRILQGVKFLTIFVSWGN
jgi:hypothetical protein